MNDTLPGHDNPRYHQYNVLIGMMLVAGWSSHYGGFSNVDGKLCCQRIHLN
jgi:hypothetical protein